MKNLFPVLFAVVFICNAGELTVSIPFEGSDLNIRSEGLFTSVYIPGMPSIFTVGAPALPVMPVKIALPTGCRASSVEAVNESWETVPGRFEIQPSSGCVPISSGEDQTQAEPDMHIYSRDSYFPSSTAQLASSSVFWGIPLAYVNVHPVRWNPASKQLQVLSSLTLSVSFTEDESVRLVSRRTAASESMAMSILERLW